MLASSELDSLSIEQIEYRKRLVFGEWFLILLLNRISNNRQYQFIITWLVDLINDRMIGEFISYKLFDPFFSRLIHRQSDCWIAGWKDQ